MPAMSDRNKDPKNIERLSTQEEQALSILIRHGLEADRKLNEIEKANAKNKGQNNEVGSQDLKSLEEASQKGMEAQNRLVEDNMGLVVHLAKKYDNRGVPLQDLIQEGYLGLLRAAQRFNPDKKSNTDQDFKKTPKFTTYAYAWILPKIQKAVAEQGRMVKMRQPQIKQIGRYNHAQDKLTKGLNHLPSLKEMADEMGISEKEVAEIESIKKGHLSLEYQMDGNSEEYVESIAVGTESQEVDSVVAEDTQAFIRQELKGALEGLDEAEREVLSMRYGLNGAPAMTLEEVVQALRSQEYRRDISIDRVRWVELQAIKKLRLRVPDFDGLQNLKKMV